jgi:hypothetical protein
MPAGHSPRFLLFLLSRPDGRRAGYMRISRPPSTASSMPSHVTDFEWQRYFVS